MEKQQIDVIALFSEHTEGSKRPRTHSCPNEMLLDPKGYICVARILTIVFDRGRHYQKCQANKNFCPIFKIHVT